MIESNLIRSNARSAMAAREILSMKPRGALAALILMLVLGVGVLSGSPPVHAQEQKPAAVPAATTVNINTADAETLAVKLKGVGESRAMEIVRYREAYGPFASAEELTEVKGIGKSTLELNRDAITLE
jgi:competence protein ComEA